MLPALAHGARVLFLDELATHSDVVEAVEHVRIGGRAVAPGAADLLIVGLDAARQVGMEDVAHVRLVDPHAEGDGGDDDHAGIWKQSDLPDPVGITVSALRPASSAVIAASWPGRKCSKPKPSFSTRRALSIGSPVVAISCTVPPVR